jgi:hypothetical protein
MFDQYNPAVAGADLLAAHQAGLSLIAKEAMCWGFNAQINPAI